MLHDIVAATHRGGYLIELEFDDGQCGVVDFSAYSQRGGVFEPFKDTDFFQRFRVDEELGVLTWEGEIQIAPEVLYAKATGSALPA
ncbi:MAG: DUF2442 domain-containing protein [Candidatus Hydrogenedentes bacterium]|nr:DUF2442 domain-containing protein [Candidatus Hydrogenedentota bacterium]